VVVQLSLHIRELLLNENDMVSIHNDTRRHFSFFQFTCRQKTEVYGYFHTLQSLSK